MNLPTFEEIVRDAYRLLGDAEEILRLPWRGDSPNDAELEALEDVRDHIAAAKDAFIKMGTSTTTNEHPDTGPVSGERTPRRRAKNEARAAAEPCRAGSRKR